MNLLQQEQRAITARDNFQSVIDRSREAFRTYDPPRKPNSVATENTEKPPVQANDAQPLLTGLELPQIAVNVLNAFCEVVEVACQDCGGTGNDAGGWDPFAEACGSCNGSGKETVERNYLAEAFRIVGDSQCSVPVERKHLAAVVQHCRIAVSTIISLPEVNVA